MKRAKLLSTDLAPEIPSLPSEPASPCSAPSNSISSSSAALQQPQRSISCVQSQRQTKRCRTEHSSGQVSDACWKCYNIVTCGLFRSLSYHVVPARGSCIFKEDLQEVMPFAQFMASIVSSPVVGSVSHLSWQVWSNRAPATYLPLTRIPPEYRSRLPERPQGIGYREERQKLVPHTSHVQPQAHIPTADAQKEFKRHTGAWTAEMQDRRPCIDELCAVVRGETRHLARRGLNKMTGLSRASVTILRASFKPAAEANMLMFYRQSYAPDASGRLSSNQHTACWQAIPWGSAAAKMSISSSSTKAPLSLRAAIPKLQSFHSLRNIAATPMSGYSCMDVSRLWSEHMPDI